MKTMSLAVVLFLTVAAASAADPGEGATSQMTDVLKCNKLDWLKNCEEINKRILENPGAPIRVVDRTGLEFAFAPGTPSVIMNHVLEPTEESAKLVVDYNEKFYKRMELAAEVAGKEVIKRGYENTALLAGYQRNSDGLMGKSEFEPLPKINTTNVRVFVFYDSKCAYCKRLLPELVLLKQRTPELALSMLQMDRDTAYLKYIKEDLGFRAASLDDRKLAEYEGRVKRTPTIWIQDMRSKKTTVIEGLTDVYRLEKAIVEVAL